MFNSVSNDQFRHKYMIAMFTDAYADLEERDS
jgi:hypothetical protein